MVRDFLAFVPAFTGGLVRVGGRVRPGHPDPPGSAGRPDVRLFDALGKSPAAGLSKLLTGADGGPFVAGPNLIGSVLDPVGDAIDTVLQPPGTPTPGQPLVTLPGVD